jgi:hypothetical protein
MRRERRKMLIEHPLAFKAEEVNSSILAAS